MSTAEKNARLHEHRIVVALIPALPGNDRTHHDQVVLFGLTLAVIGLVLAIFPRPLVVAATRYRISMPGRSTPNVVRAARIGALAVLAVGIVIALA